jgi:omega-6 fatty acid desaturase (delta-12 desaturase)
VPEGSLAVDSRGRERSLDVEDFRRAIPERCYAIDAPRAWLSLGRALAVVAASQAALAFWPVHFGLGLVWQLPGLLALWLLAGFGLTGLFVLGHDCGHFAFSRGAPPIGSSVICA